MLEQKIKDWIKKEMVMSKVSDQIQIKTYIHNNEKVTYAFIGGLPIRYCYFVAVMLSTYTNQLIPFEDYYKIVNTLHNEWESVVDITHYRTKYKKQMAELLKEDDLYIRQQQTRKIHRPKTKSILPMFALKQELKAVRRRQKKKTPDLNSLDIIGIIVQDMERIYKSSYNDPVMI